MKTCAVINSCYRDSTGKIATNLHHFLLEKGYDSVLYYARDPEITEERTLKFEKDWECSFHAFVCRVFGIEGTCSTHATKRLINSLKSRNVDTVFLVNIHGYYLNQKMLLKYIGESNTNLVYIMGDEFPFMGRCGYNNECMNFLHGCGNCPQLKEYPQSYFFDRSREMYRLKKESYGFLKKAVFVGPAYTINESQKSPLLKGRKTCIIDESIDAVYYHPRDVKELKKELKIGEDKTVFVCIAPMSYERKGCRYFIDLARKFENDERFIFVHVGYNIKKKDGLPSNYIAIGYVKDQELLAKYYSLGDLFVFPSLLDTMPNACLEAMACGTPLLCFNTSGMPYIADDTVATFVEPKNVEAMAEVVLSTPKKTQETIERVRAYALNRYDNRNYNQKLIDSVKLI